MGPASRYERPQAGRYRQHNQLSMELFGNAEPSADAEVIFVSYLLCKELGLDVSIHINSLGSNEAREEYVQLLKEYAKPKRGLLCEDCKKRLAKNPLRLLDCKEESCRSIFASAPLLVDHLDEESKKHFVAVLEHLDESSVPYELDPYIVRGLDYYTRTTFEFVSGFLGAQNAVAAGGRYDTLVEEIGGPPTPALGFSIGMERLYSLFDSISVQKKPPKIFIVALGEKGQEKAFSLLNQLLREGIPSIMDYSGGSLKSHMRRADKLEVSSVLIIGEDEINNGIVTLRDMTTKTQTEIPLSEVIERLKNIKSFKSC